MLPIIRLDLALTANLEWKREKEKAKTLVESGKKLIFELDLGFFNRLQYPLENPFQFQAFERGLEHAQKELFDPFQDHVQGIVLYRGHLDFLNENRSDISKPENARAFFEYLSLFSRTIAPFYTRMLLFDGQGLSSDEVALRLFEKSAEPFEIYLRGVSLPGFRFWEIGEEGLQFFPETKAALALALPADIPEALHPRIKTWMKGSKDPYRLIEQENLTTSWDGLDTLHIFSDQIDEDTERKLQGFLAAGGEVIYC